LSSIKRLSSGHRNLIVSSLTCDIKKLLQSPFTLLVPAYTEEEQARVILVAADLLPLGCKEICCVGSRAESLHDMLDGLIESSSNLDIVTTWHADVIEAAEYFIFAAGGASTDLVALISDHASIAAALNETINDLTK
jgi:hypothetical protein